MIGIFTVYEKELDRRTLCTLERWVHGFNGKNGVRIYDPNDRAFWLGRVAGRQTYVEESTWFSEGDEENYSGGFWKCSKRFKELTLEGPFKAQDLRIKTPLHRAFNTREYRWPAGRRAQVVTD